MRLYKQIHKRKRPNLYNMLNTPNSKKIKLDDGTELKIKRILGSIVGVHIINKKKGFGGSRLYQLIG
jgi:hypothetical protein